MKRRDFVRCSGAVAGLGILDLRALFAQASESEPWRVFEITTRVEVLRPDGPTRVWLPTPLAVAPYQKTLGDTYHAGGGSAVMIETNPDEPDILGASWDPGVEPVLTLTSRVATRGHAANLATPTVVPPPDMSAFARFLRPTKLIPTDGIVLVTANRILTGVRGGDIEKARAIYEWICDNSFRDPRTRGCGLGDIKFMLETKSMGGKCADINALYVGLARASGIPARDVYGVRVADSDRGYRALGKAGDITRAQHCRAEFFADGYGWIPVDPGDVRKVMLEEPPGNLAVDDPKVTAARAFLFGNWEMNWLAYNYAHDLKLPNSTGKAVPFLMYPQAEVGDERKDSLDPTTFRYTITSRELT
jgi:transglutaminase-like putative cysteine protease